MWPHRRRRAPAQRIVERTFQISAKQVGQNISLARARRRHVTACASTTSTARLATHIDPIHVPVRELAASVSTGQLLKFQPESQEHGLVVTASREGSPRCSLPHGGVPAMHVTSTNV